MNNQNNKVELPRDPFAYIAFWQLMTFIILILLVWLNELQDGTSLFFNMPPHEFSLFRACVLTAVVLLGAVITIGNTYLQQRRVLKSMVAVCSNCHRVRLNNEVWQKMEEYIGERSLLTFSHGLCPECTRELMKTIEKK
jgi:Mn2+/Fe2+ NRAMP family transporter